MKNYKFHQNIPVLFRLFLLAFVIAGSLSSCGEEEMMNSSVKFKMKYDDAPLVMFEELQYPDGKNMFFTRISFFVENLKLVNSSGQEFMLLDRDYVDLTADHGTNSSAEAGTFLGNIDLSPDVYNVNFDIGVNSNDNKKTPIDFTSDDVLSRTSEYWVGWKSYIFARVEGKIDLNGDGVIEEGFSLHMGGDDAFKSIVCNDKVVDDHNSEIVIEIDLEKLFGSGNNLYDIAANPQIHAPTQNEFVKELAANFVTCFR